MAGAVSIPTVDNVGGTQYLRSLVIDAGTNATDAVVVTLGGDVSVDGGDVTIDGDIRAPATRAIGTAQSTLTAGAVNLAVTSGSVSATATGVDLLINTSATTGGNVALGRFDVAGHRHLNDLTVNNHGSGGTSGSTTLHGSLRLDDNGALDPANLVFTGAGDVIISNSLTIDLSESSKGVDAGSVDFGESVVLADAPGFGLTINTSHSAAGDTAGSIQGLSAVTKTSRSYLDTLTVNMGSNAGTDGTLSFSGSAPVIEVDGTAGTQTSDGLEIIGKVTVPDAGSLCVATNPANTGGRESGQIDLDQAVIDGAGSLTLDTSGGSTADPAGHVRLGDVGANARLTGISVDTRGGITAGTLYLEDNRGDTTASLRISTGNIDFRNAATVILVDHVKIDTEPTAVHLGNAMFAATGTITGATKELTVDVRGGNVTDHIDNDGDVTLPGRIGSTGGAMGSLTVLADGGAITVGHDGGVPKAATVNTGQTNGAYAVQFGSNTVLTGDTTYTTNGGNADFSDTLFSSHAGQQRTLLIDTTDHGAGTEGNVQLAGAGNFGGNYLASLDIDTAEDNGASGKILLFNDSSPSVTMQLAGGTVRLNGPVELQQDVRIDTYVKNTNPPGGNITFTWHATIDSQTSQAYNLTLDAGTISLNANLGAIEALNTLVISDTTGRVILGGADLANQAATPDLGPVTLVRTVGQINFGSGLADNDVITGGIELNAGGANRGADRVLELRTIGGSGDIRLNGAVTLQSDALLTTNGNSGLDSGQSLGGNILLTHSTPVDSYGTETNDLELRAGTGTISLNANLGAIEALNTLVVSDTTGRLTLGGADLPNQAATPDLGPVTLVRTVGQINFGSGLADNDVITGGIELNAGGTNHGADRVLELRTIGGNGDIRLNGAVTLQSDALLTTNGNDGLDSGQALGGSILLTHSVPIDSYGTETNDLELRAGTGTISLNANLGAIEALNTLVISDTTGRVTLGGADQANQAAAPDLGPVTLVRTVGQINFGSGLADNDVITGGIELNAGGIELNAGGTNHGADRVLELRTISGSGDIRLNGAVTLQSDALLTTNGNDGLDSGQSLGGNILLTHSAPVDSFGTETNDLELRAGTGTISLNANLGAIEALNTLVISDTTGRVTLGGADQANQAATPDLGPVTLVRTVGQINFGSGLADNDVITGGIELNAGGANRGADRVLELRTIGGSGDIRLNGAVTLQSDALLTTNGNSGLDSGQSLGGNILLTHSTSVDSYGTETNDLELRAGTGTISLNANLGAIEALNTLVVSDTTGRLTLGGADLPNQAATPDLGPVTLVRTVGQINFGSGLADNDVITGGIELNAGGTNHGADRVLELRTIGGNGDIRLNGAVTLQSDALLTTNGNDGLDSGQALGGSILLTHSAPIDSYGTETNDLELRAGTGTISLNANLGEIEALNTLVVSDTTGRVTLGGADQADQAATPDLGPVTLVNTNGAIDIGSTAVITGGIVFDGGGDNDNLLTDSLLTITTTNATVRLNGPVTLNSDLTITAGSGAGDITFAAESTIDSQETEHNDLKLTAGTGGIAFAGAVGGTAPLGTVTIGTAGAVTASSSFIVASLNETAAATGNVSFQAITTVAEARTGGAVTLWADRMHLVSVKGVLDTQGGSTLSGQEGYAGGSTTITGGTIVVAAINTSGSGAAMGSGLAGGNAGAISLTATGANITLNGNLTAHGGAGDGGGVAGSSGTVTLSAKTGASQAAGVIRATQLLLRNSVTFQQGESGNDFSLSLKDAGNAVDTLAANVNGSIDFTNAQSLTVDTVSDMLSTETKCVLDPRTTCAIQTHGHDLTLTTKGDKSDLTIKQNISVSDTLHDGPGRLNEPKIMLDVAGAVQRGRDDVSLQTATGRVGNIDKRIRGLTFGENKEVIVQPIEPTRDFSTTGDIIVQPVEIGPGSGIHVAPLGFTQLSIQIVDAAAKVAEKNFLIVVNWIDLDGNHEALFHYPPRTADGGSPNGSGPYDGGLAHILDYRYARNPNFATPLEPIPVRVSIKFDARVDSANNATDGIVFAHQGTPVNFVATVFLHLSGPGIIAGPGRPNQPPPLMLPAEPPPQVMAWTPVTTSQEPVARFDAVRPSLETQPQTERRLEVMRVLPDGQEQPSGQGLATELLDNREELLSLLANDPQMELGRYRLYLVEPDGSRRLLMPFRKDWDAVGEPVIAIEAESQPLEVLPGSRPEAVVPPPPATSAPSTPAPDGAARPAANTGPIEQTAPAAEQRQPTRQPWDASPLPARPTTERRHA